MKLKDVEKAMELARDLERVRKSLEEVREAKCFKLEFRAAYNHGRYEFVGHCDGVAEGQSGSFGHLATSLKEAAISYYKFHEEQLVASLEELGVR